MSAKFRIKIWQYIKLDFIIYFIIANLLILASNIPLILRFIHTPPGMIFNFSHIIWDHDYNLYRSAIIQGKYGAWLYHDAFTSDPTSPGIFYIFYVFIGKIAYLFNLSSSFAYHLVRIISLEIFVILVYVLARSLLGKRGGLMAAYLALTGSIAPLWLFKEKLNISFAIHWWTTFDPLERLNTLPHYIIAQNFLLLSIILFVYFLRNQRIKLAVCSAISIFIGGISFPAVLAPIGAALSLSVIYLIFREKIVNRKIIINKHIFIGLTAIILTAFLSLLIIRLQEHQGFPWNDWTLSNVIRWNYGESTFNYNLFFIFGVLPLIAFPSIIRNLLSGNIEMIFITLWFLLPYILLPFVNVFQIPKLRLVEDAHFIPIAILASQTLSSILSNLKSRFISLGMFVLYLLITLPVIVTLFIWRISFIASNFPAGVYYSNKNEYSGMEYVLKEVPKNSVIITSLSHIIPAYAPVVSYWGHMNMTNSFAIKEVYLKLFFSNQMTENEAKEFLLSNNIDYIYVGPVERKLSSKPISYNFIYAVYRDDAVTIFKVLKTR